MGPPLSFANHMTEGRGGGRRLRPSSWPPRREGKRRTGGEEGASWQARPPAAGGHLRILMVEGEESQGQEQRNLPGGRGEPSASNIFTRRDNAVHCSHKLFIFFLNPCCMAAMDCTTLSPSGG